MKQRINSIVVLFLFASFCLHAQIKEVNLKFVETSDVHGNYYPYDFIQSKDASGSLARVSAFVKKKRELYKDNLILIDNGDILQGQPTAYYYNFIDTLSTHLTADMMNYIGYNVGNMGNHDVETGHSVYDRWIKECQFPVLGANIVRTSDGSPYLKPYEIIVRDGVKIAFLGMITPAIPSWLPEKLWEGLRFEDMEETAKKWMKIIKEKETPDIIIGVFHSGKDAVAISDKYNENASVTIAKNVPGFDILFIGHDHLRERFKVENIEGDSVLIMDPGSRADVVANVDVKVTLKDGKITDKKITGVLSNVDKYGVDEEFVKRFALQYNTVKDFVSRKIGRFVSSISTKTAYFGPSAFIDFIHLMQLQLTGADISFVAPLSYDAEISEGDITVADMFNLYKFENMLYTMKLSGKEIKGFMEMSYALWTNQMKSPEDHVLLLREKEGSDETYFFKNFSFNFDSAAGIIYTVDVTKPGGDKINIISMADGTPFDEGKVYKVAMNSYRGNGGGDLLTKGAGIPKEQLKDRIISSTTEDLRYFLMKYIEEKQVLNPQSLNQWKLIPEEWTKPASERDYQLLFGDK